LFLALENRYSEISSTEPTTMSRESETAFASGTVAAETVDETASRQITQTSTPTQRPRQEFFTVPQAIRESRRAKTKSPRAEARGLFPLFSLNPN
jgi:hypothetical protein